ncbi:hypothetical protein [Aquisalimonas asiatica]|uniref:Uncharacterized protein n=1 Tax=Aquisalimonas asiatica TaxID=406100 RepID=A0A1H8VYX3_9GAMM|nr:hypothetical protein [Aquisalimonas asiatica]SEP20457.1 hypothetical protein SAMN04488052_1261 [Aquisalimonas asiatica]
MTKDGSEATYYTDTAFTGYRHEDLSAGRNLESMGYFQRASFGTRLPLLGPQCREYVAVGAYASAMDIVKGLPPEERERRLDNNDSHKHRRWASGADPLVIVALIGNVSIYLAILCPFAAFMIVIFSFGEMVGVVKDMAWILVFFLLMVSVWFLSMFAVNSGFLGFGRDTRFQRCTGMVSLWAGRRVGRLELPFEEFEAFAAPTSTAVGTYRYRLVLVHRSTDYTVAYPGEQLEVWETQLVWEELQQFMDVREPLPDIPELEGVRHRDPVTAVHDSESGRPESYWLELSDDHVSALHEQARRSAEVYPWGLTRDQALASGWRPSGVGEGDWRTAKPA